MSAQSLDAGTHLILVLQLENFLSMSRGSEIKRFLSRRESVFSANMNSCYSHQPQIKYMKSKQSNSHESHYLFSVCQDPDT